MANATNANWTRTVTLTGTVAIDAPVTIAGGPATAAASAWGVAQLAGVSGDVVPVVMAGSAEMTSGAAIAVGAALEVHTTVSQVVTRSAGVTIGRALTAAAGAGEKILVALIPN